MLEACELLQQARHHLSRCLCFGVRFIEPAQVGQSMGQREGCFHPCQRGVYRNGANDLFGEHVSTRVEIAVQAVCFPAKSAELRVGLGVLITEVGVCRLDFLSNHIREVRRLLCFLLCVGQGVGYSIRHLGHREPANCSCPEQQHNQKLEADCQYLTNRPELERELHLATATAS